MSETGVTQVLSLSGSPLSFKAQPPTLHLPFPSDRSDCFRDPRVRFWLVKTKPNPGREVTLRTSPRVSVLPAKMLAYRERSSALDYFILFSRNTLFQIT